MKLKKNGEPVVVYFDATGEKHYRDYVLAQVQGKPISEGKAVVSQYQRAEEQEWVDRDGNVIARSFTPDVMSIEIKPADADARRAEYLRRLREAQARVASLAGQPDASPQEIAAATADAMRLMAEYEEFMSLLDD